MNARKQLVEAMAHYVEQNGLAAFLDAVGEITLQEEEAALKHVRGMDEPDYSLLQAYRDIHSTVGEAQDQAQRAQDYFA